MNKKDESNPKRFMFRKKRVKQPSTLKKQILKERLKLHEQVSLVDLASVEGGKLSKVCNEVFVFGLVDEETNLQDTDEVTEIINNTKELFGEYGLILTVEIAMLSTAVGTNTTIIVISYPSTEEAQTAAKITDKLVLGGSTIRVFVHPSLSPLSTSLLVADEPATESFVKSHSYHPTSQIANNLLLWNIMSEDDLDSPDVIEESMQDILSLCRPCTHKPTINLIQHVISRNTSNQIYTVYQHQIQLEYEAKQALKKKNKGIVISSSLPPLVIIETGHIINALLLGSKINGLQIGGEVLQSRYFCSFSDSEDIVHFTFASTFEDDVNQIFGLQISHPHMPADLLFAQLQEAAVLVPDVLSTAPLLGPLGITLTFTTLTNLITVHRSLSTYNATLMINVFVKSGNSEDSEMKVPNQVTLGIQGYLTAIDLHDSTEEELLTAKQDLLQIIHDVLELCENEYERAVECDIQRVYLLTTDTHEDSSQNSDAVIQLGFANLENAQCNLLYFEGLVIGGRRVIARLLPAMDDGDTVQILSAPHDEDTMRTVNLSREEEEAQRLTTLMSQQRRTVLYHEDIAPPPLLDTPSTCTAEPSASYPARKISHYLLAKQAPKLGYHPTDRHLPIPHATEEINFILKEFLALLSSFQLRLRESKKSALVFKQKQRFVTGIKQATNAVKAGKVKLLLIAPNTEAAEAIDDKLSLLINTAQVLQVPVLYALSKRWLGKALQMSMKQSVVAVFIPDGAYEQFRKVLAFLKPKD